MTIPNFLHEAFQHGLEEHMALRDEKTKYFEDAKDHPRGEEERAHLTKLHSKAVGSDNAGRMIRGYTAHSKKINEGLIKNNGSPDPIHKAVHEGLMNVHKNAAPLERDHHVYSSLGKFNPSTVLGPDKVFRTPAHVSASTKPAVAVSHANMRRDWTEAADEHVMHFHLPKGHTGATYIAGRSHYPEESEMLIKPNSTFKVHSTTTVPLSNGKTRTIWHVKPHDPTLHEATYHDPHVFRGMDSSYGKSKHFDKHNFAVNAHQSAMTHNVFDHHTELAKDAPKNDGLENEHTAALRGYTHGSFGMNEALLKKHSGAEIHDMFKPHHEGELAQGEKVSAAIAHHAKPLTRETHVYSGISTEHADLIKNGGGVVHTPAFTSTSISPNQAHRFAKQSHITSTTDETTRTYDAKYDKHVLHFKLPAGYKKGVYVAPISPSHHEAEYLLDKGQHWKVTGKKTVNRPFTSTSASTGMRLRQQSYTHIWTLEPHEPHLHEATKHDPSYFRGFSITHKHQESGNMESPLYGHGDSPTARAYNSGIEDLKERTRQDVKAQHTKLLSTAPQHGSLGDHVDDIQHAEVLRSHTISSHQVNRSLLKKHSGTHDGDDHYNLRDADRTSAAIQHFAKPADHEMHVYSGLKHDAIKQAHDAGHTVVHMPAFTSTTINPNAATGFASDLKHKHIPGDRGTHVSGVNHVAHFKIPKGYNKGVYVAGVSEHANEKEYLLDKGQSWKITGHKRVSNVNASTNYGKYKEIEHTHIWTLEPHDEHPGGGKLHESEDMTKKLDEAVRHSEHFFSGTMGFDKVHGHSALVKHTGDGGKIDFTPDHEEMQKQHVSLRNSHKVVDAQAAHVIKKYTGHSAAVNKHLIAPKVLSFLGQDHTRHAHLMSEAIQRHAKPLRHDTHVYSGLGNHDPSKDFDKTGTVHLPAFTSTSLNPTVALAFGPDKPKKQTTHILHFHLPKGYKKSLYVAGHSAVKDEREMLLDKGQKWQLTGVKKSKMKVEYGKNIKGEQDHHRDVMVWSLRPHHSQMNEAYEHNPHPLAHAEGEATQLDYHPPESNDDHHDEHLHLHALHNRDHDPEHMYHVQNYTNYSHDINRHLITGGKHEVDDEVHEMHAHLQKAIAEAKPLEREHHVYSHCGINPTGKKMTNAEGHMQTPAYTSTSINPEIAGMHANLGTATRHMAHFHLPKGYKGGLYVGGYSNHHEQEMLLAPNQRFQKTGEQIIHVDHDGYKTKTIVHSFKPIDHLHEALVHDPSVFHDAHPSGDHLLDVAIKAGDPHEHQQHIMNFVSHRNDKLREGRKAATPEAERLAERATHHYKLSGADEHYAEHGSYVAHKHVQVYDQDTKGHLDRHAAVPFHSYSEDSYDTNKHLIDKHQTGIGSAYADKHEGRAHTIGAALKAHAAPLEQTHHVYSGMRGFDPSEHFKKNNGVIHTPAFTSTSINPHTAMGFDKDMATNGKDRHILHFELPKGYNKGAYIGHHSEHPHEQEYLLDKGQSWKLKHHEVAYTHGTDWNEGFVEKRHIWTVTPHEDK